MFIDFRERKGERERERERERETLMGCLPYMPGMGVEPATSLQPTEPPGQGHLVLLICISLRINYTGHLC